MFALNIAYRSLATDVENLNGVVSLPAENFSHRRVTSEFAKMFFDPQLYLSGLALRNCGQTCAKLASYPWFQINDVPQYSPQSKIKEWQESVKRATQTNWKGTAPVDAAKSCLEAITFQVAARCSHIILPSPLITMRENEGQIQAQWLDTALDVAINLEPTQPILATVAIDEGQLNDDSFLPAGFLDTIVDQITARRGISGVYIVIAQSQLDHPFKSNAKVNKAYLYLTKKFSNSGVENIVINFADIFGLVCAAAGATTVATGQYQSIRRLCLREYEEGGGGGGALPRYYSNPTISEYLSKTDMDKIVGAGMLRRVEDPTIFGNPLLKTLASGGTSSTVPEWAESPSNVSASTKHLIQSLINFSGQLKTEKDRSKKIFEWLEDAEMYQSLLVQKLGQRFPDRRAPISEWISIAREILG